MLTHDPPGFHPAPPPNDGDTESLLLKPVMTTPMALASRDKNLQLMTFLVFLSGAAGLAYEVSWSRQLGLVFGQTARAAAIVLGAYFLGMSLGYALASRLAPTWRRPLFGFAAAEVLVGAWAFAVPGLLTLMPSNILDGVTRVLVAVFVLLPGTIALGASPALCCRDGRSSRRHLPKDDPHLCVEPGRRRPGRGPEYGRLGPRGGDGHQLGGGRRVDGGGSGCVGLRPHDVHFPSGSPSDSASDPSEPGLPQPVFPESRKLSTVWVAAAAVSGFGTLAAQVLYMRLFSLVFHNSTYTFAAILLVVLLSLSLASALTGRLRKRFDGTRLLVTTSLSVAGAFPTSVGLFVVIGQYRYFGPGDTFLVYILGAIAVVALVIAGPMVAMGLMLPLSWDLAGAQKRPGHVMGRLATVNTLAAAAGALGTSFVIIPALGLWGAIGVVSVTYLLMAVGLIRHAARTRPRTRPPNTQTEIKPQLPFQARRVPASPLGGSGGASPWAWPCWPQGPPWLPPKSTALKTTKPS